jgi:hypothetical protein
MSGRGRGRAQEHDGSRWSQRKGLSTFHLTNSMGGRTNSFKASKKTLSDTILCLDLVKQAANCKKNHVLFIYHSKKSFNFGKDIWTELSHVLA